MVKIIALGWVETMVGSLKCNEKLPEYDVCHINEVPIMYYSVILEKSTAVIAAYDSYNWERLSLR